MDPRTPKAGTPKAGTSTVKASQASPPTGEGAAAGGTPAGRPIAAVAMAHHINHTPFPSQYFQSVDQHGDVFHIIALRVTYDMQTVGADGTIGYAAQQTPLATEDAWSGAVNESSPLWESDLAPQKPQCDVIVAHAVSRPPAEARGLASKLVGSQASPQAKRWQCGLALQWRDEDDQPRDWRKQLTVTGPRSFGLMGLSEPKAASEVPIDWTRAYGGQDKRPAQDQLKRDGSVKKAAGADRWKFDPRNPVGAGIDKRSGAPGPQLEVGIDRPYTGGLTQGKYPPISLGPLGRAWLPRRTLAGTYDDAWLKTQWPLPPMDFDFAYWNGAPQDQQTDYLPPGTRIHLMHLHPPGSATTRPDTWSAKLPMHQLYVYAYYSDIRGRGLDIDMALDTLVIDMKAQQVYATHRLVVPASATSAGALVLETRMYPVGQPQESVPSAELGPLG